MSHPSSNNNESQSQSVDSIPEGIAEKNSGPHTPATDFYRFVNGDWLSSHTIPADYPLDGTFIQLHDRSQKEVRELVEQASPDSRLGAFYHSFMDEEGINNAGHSPLIPDLDPILAAHDLEELTSVLGSLGQTGISSIVSFYTAKDPQVDIERLYIFQSGLGLPDESYYHKPQHEPVLNEYRTHLIDMWSLLDPQFRPDSYKDADPTRIAEVLIEFETLIAQGHWDTVSSRDVDKTVNPRSWSDLPTAFPFATLLRSSSIDPEDADTLIINQPSFLEHIASIAQDTDLDTWKLWALWQVISSRAPFLSQDFVDTNFRFSQILTGAQEQRPRWKRAVAMLSSAIGEDIGQEFVSRHFPPSYKDTMMTLVSYLLEAYRERISSLPWMSLETRNRALEKLSLFHTKIGYPDRWRDYDGFSPLPTGSDLIANIRQISRINHSYGLSRLGKPVDRDRWHFTPQVVNACYDPTMNDITFPAAILRPPFFDPEADMASNLGGIGAVIGHEIGHGFDDQGSKYDGKGNVLSWWSPEDRDAFEELTAKLIPQYEGKIPLGLQQRGIEDHKVNGAFTLGENIGDLGGLGIAVVALKRYLKDQGIDSSERLPVPGFEGEYTALQRFFLRWAQIWATAARPQIAAQYLTIDPHSPAEFRCNIPCSNIPEYYEAFDIKPGDPMYLPEEERVIIW